MLGADDHCSRSCCSPLAHTAHWQVYLASSLLGVGVGFAFASMANLIVEAVRPDQTGVATGMNAVMRTIGGAIGGQVAASILAASLLADGMPDEHGYTLSFIDHGRRARGRLVASLAVPGRKPHRLHVVSAAEPQLVDGGNAAVTLRHRCRDRRLAGGDAALRFAFEEARLRGLPLRIVCAWAAPTAAYIGEAFAPTPDVFLAAEDHAEEMLRTALERLASDPAIHVEALSVEGNPAIVLVEQARDAKLLIVGSRGRGAAASSLLGSVSQSIAHHTPCPLVIVPYHDH